MGPSRDSRAEARKRPEARVGVSRTVLPRSYPVDVRSSRGVGVVAGVRIPRMSAIGAGEDDLEASLLQGFRSGRFLLSLFFLQAEKDLLGSAHRFFYPSRDLSSLRIDS